MLTSSVPRSNGRTIEMPSTQGTVDPVYSAEEYKRWRESVIARAGFRCEWVECGVRCSKGRPHRLFADHIKELRDGGEPFDPYNGQCLCGRHHSLKTARARAKRACHGGV